MGVYVCVGCSYAEVEMVLVCVCVDETIVLCW